MLSLPFPRPWLSPSEGDEHLLRSRPTPSPSGESRSRLTGSFSAVSWSPGLHCFAVPRQLSIRPPATGLHPDDFRVLELALQHRWALDKLIGLSPRPWLSPSEGD